MSQLAGGRVKISGRSRREMDSIDNTMFWADVELIAATIVVGALGFVVAGPLGLAGGASVEFVAGKIVRYLAGVELPKPKPSSLGTDQPSGASGPQRATTLAEEVMKYQPKD